MNEVQKHSDSPPDVFENDKILLIDYSSGLMPGVAESSQCIRSSSNVNLQQRFFLAGFRDCRMEVLRYLVDIEQVPSEGPVILGLEQHLSKLETVMQTSYESDDISLHKHPYPKEKCISSSSSELLTDAGAEHTEVHLQEVKYADKTLYLSHFNLGLQSLDQPDPCILDDLQRCQQEQNCSFDSGCEASHISCSSVNCSVLSDCDLMPFPSVSTIMDNNTSSIGTQEEISESELAENARELIRLAQNNPKISRILDELFILMDDECIETDEDTDSSDTSYNDNDDDGVEMDSDESIPSNTDISNNS